MMKLLLAGLALIALGLGLVVFTNLNPAILFIIGVACAFIAVLHGSRPMPEPGSAAPAGSADGIGDAYGAFNGEL